MAENMSAVSATAPRRYRTWFASRTGVASAGASRILVTVIQGCFALISTPLLLHALGVEAYGTYALIVGFPALLPFLDFGLGAALTSTVARIRDGVDVSAAVAEVSATFGVLLAVAAAIAVVSSASFIIVPWSDVLGVPSHAGVQISPVIMIWGLALALPLSVASRILIALRRSGSAGFLGGAVPAVVSLVGIVALSALKGSLAGFVAVQALGVVLAPLACAVIAVRIWPEAIQPKLWRVTYRAANRVIRAGLPFVVGTLATVVAYETDLLVVSHVLNQTSVATYAISLKYFNLIYPAIAAAGFALWPVLSSTLDGSTLSERRAVLARWTLRFATAGILSVVVLWAASGPFIRLWTHDRIHAPALLIAGRALFVAISAIHYPAAMTVLAMGHQRFQAATLTAMALVNLPLSILLTMRIGVAGPILGTCIAFTLVHALPQAWVAAGGVRSSKGLSR